MTDNYKAYIFDMDGTLIDSMWMWRKIDIEFLARYNIPLPEDLQKQIEGMNFYETAVYFKHFFNIPESIEEIMAIWNEMALDKYRYEVELKPDVRLFLEQSKAKGIKLGIATSNSTQLAMSALASLGITNLFDVIITGNDVKKGKPDPEIYLACLDRLNCLASDCLVFEDIIPGIEAGHSAGMKVCAVYDDYSAKDDSTKRQLADYYIKCYKEILL